MIPYIKPEEAKEKACPIHRDKCKATDCMMWRWKDKKKPLDTNELGYCGIAGAPQTWIIHNHVEPSMLR